MELTNCNQTTAVIGIIGTLSGVILGSIINQISRVGRIKLYVREFRLDISKRVNGHSEKQESIDHETSEVSINFNLDIYNSTSEQKIGREIFLVILKDRKETKEKILDLATTRYGQFQPFTDKLVNFNIPPKTIENLNLTSYINKENIKLINGSILLFEFKDYKNRRIRIKLK